MNLCMMSYVSPHTDIDIDECQSEGICGTHSNCTNTLGSFMCLCDVGYERVNSTMCEGKHMPQL